MDFASLATVRVGDLSSVGIPSGFDAAGKIAGAQTRRYNRS